MMDIFSYCYRESKFIRYGFWINVVLASFCWVMLLFTYNSTANDFARWIVGLFSAL